MNSVDLYINNYFLVNKTDGFTSFFYFLTTLFDFSYYFFLLFFAFSFLIYKKKNLAFLNLFVFTISLTILIVFALKTVFDIERPMHEVAGIFGASFPSYHSTMGSVFFILLNHIFYYSLNFFHRIFSFITVLLVAFSRVYLGVHWLSDVLAGLFLGVVISYACIKLFEQKGSKL